MLRLVAYVQLHSEYAKIKSERQHESTRIRNSQNDAIKSVPISRFVGTCSLQGSPVVQFS